MTALMSNAEDPGLMDDLTSTFQALGSVVAVLLLFVAVLWGAYWVTRGGKALLPAIVIVVTAVVTAALVTYMMTF